MTTGDARPYADDGYGLMPTSRRALAVLAVLPALLTGVVLAVPSADAATKHDRPHTLPLPVPTPTPTPPTPTPTPTKRNAVTGPTGACTGTGTESYANGRIPLTVLCPLAGAPGQYMRADAAWAFSKLNKVFKAKAHRNICVGNSYRPYAVQVSLYKTKPKLAAIPGTSNHGWGTALDLCDGEGEYGTKQYVWLMNHAGEFGWQNPEWAHQGNGREEPWHWEYVGTTA